MARTASNIGMLASYREFRADWISEPRQAVSSAASTSPLLTILVTVLTDVLALMLASLLSGLLTGQYTVEAMLGVLRADWPLMCLAVIGYAAAGLYPSVGMAPAHELRTLTRTSTFIYAVFGVAAMFLADRGIGRAGLGLILGWVFTLVAIPLGRALLQALCANQKWYGYPVVILGGGKTGRLVVRALQHHPSLGLKPVAVLDDYPGGRRFLRGVPIVGGLRKAAELSRVQGIRYAIIAMPGVQREKLLELLETHCNNIPHVMVIPDLFGISSLWVMTRDVGGVLGLEIRKNLLMRHNWLIKRTLDYALGIPLFLAAAPIMGVLALLIKAVSPGPAFYIQKRVGYHGIDIDVFKLRTMYADADARLKKHLEEDDEARAEWKRCFKLKNDPRILPGVGHFLRKTSLDELPQFWNVVRGDMSLVGPRPFPSYHYGIFNEEFRALRQSVLPGITGLWQVSARSDGDLQIQESLDSYYVRNWSPWLDLYILACTVWVVARGKGAY